MIRELTRGRYQRNEETEQAVGGNGGQRPSFASLCGSCAAVPPHLTFCEEMKALGIILAACSLIASIPVFQVFHEITFGESKLVRMFEIEPPEGYAYWERKEFWEDLWVFIFVSLVLLITAYLPVVAAVVRSEAGRARKIGLMISAFVLAVPPLFFSIPLLSPPHFDIILIAAFFPLLGCSFSIFCAICAETTNEVE